MEGVFGEVNTAVGGGAWVVWWAPAVGGLPGTALTVSPWWCVGGAAAARAAAAAVGLAAAAAAAAAVPGIG